MEVLAILFLIIILIVLISLKSSVNDKFRRIEKELGDMKKLIKSNISDDEIAMTQKAAQVQPAKESIPKKDYWESGFKVQEETQPAPSLQQEVLKQAEEIPIPSKKLQPAKEPLLQKTVEIRETITPPGKPFVPIPEPSFFERHPDIEKFIGENLISKIGIAILVLAIGFFVKYAIDKNWIGPVARVSIGILCGGILITLAHRLRKNYQAFSSVLVGGGIAILYFTIALAYHQFQLFGQTVSFIIMVVITGFAVALSMLYNRQELAVIALVGGFATPLLVSDGGGNFKVLFTYLLVLNAGLLVIAYNRSWRILNSLAFAFTVILFLLWLIGLPTNPPRDTYVWGFLFATAFYVLFFIINIANNVKENKQFIAFDFSILLANTALYFSAGLYFITALNQGEYRGLFTAILGAFNLAASLLLFRKQKVDRNILYLLIGVTVSFISLTAPIQLKGNYITLFWATECVLLYWLYQRSKIHIIQLASMIVWLAMLLSLFMDWILFYSDSAQNPTIIFNKGFITTIYAAVSSYLLFVLRKKTAVEDDRWSFKLPLGAIFRIVSLILLFMSGFLEINKQFSSPSLQPHVKWQYILLYTYLFIFIYCYIRKRNTGPAIPPESKYLLLACLVIYLFSIGLNFAFQFQVLQNKTLSIHLVAHWAAMVILAMIFLTLVQVIRQSFKAAKDIPAITWLLCCWIVIYLSVEINLVIQNNFSAGTQSLHSLNQSYIKSGLPILWGLCSFIFMWLGMKHKYRPLRIISLVLFLITLIKLFAFDIRNISAGGKIAAFFCLGVLLLIISFMYQRLKQIIIEDADKPVS